MCHVWWKRWDSKSHIFRVSLCLYTIWDKVAGKLIGRIINLDWSDMLKLNIVRGGASTHMEQVLIRLLFQVVVYHVWRERNLRRHKQGHKRTKHMISMINKLFKNRISSLDYKGITRRTSKKVVQSFWLGVELFVQNSLIYYSYTKPHFF